MTDNNHHETAEDTVGSDDTEKPRLEQRKVITQSLIGLTDSATKA